jgi:hypothetical protein
MQLCRAYKLPLLINTKGNLLASDDSYFDLVASHPAPVIMSITLIGTDDKIVRRYEPNAPLASERLELIRKFRDAGVPTVVYCGPYMRGVTDLDLEGYISSLIEYGAVGVHLRNFYITGKMQTQALWKRYLDKYEKDIVKDGHVMKWGSPHLGETYQKMQEIADGIDSRFRVVGMKSHWFELNPVHGKLAMDWLPAPFKDGIIDFTAIPIMRKVRENMDEPQLMVWDEIGYKQDKINTPQSVAVVGGPFGEAMWIASGAYGCVGGASTPRGKTAYVDGWGWVVKGLWDGMARKPGFISTQSHVFPVSNGEGKPIEQGGHTVYSYIPKRQQKEMVSDDGTVPWALAKTFKVPTRLGGTEDKWYEDANVFDLGERWKATTSTGR